MNSQRRGFDRPQLVTPSVSPLQALSIAVGAADLNRVYELNLNDLIIDQDVQVRVDGLNEETVETYIAILENGGQLEPITVIRCDDGEHYVADGFHRVEAHIRAGRATIQARVQDGNRDTALDFSEEGNLRHGQPLTYKDRKNVLRRRLGRNGHPWQSLSNGQLAKELGVDPKTIGNWVKELEATMENSIVKRTQTIGSDGRVYNTANIGQTPRAAQPRRDDGYVPMTPDERQELSEHITHARIDTGNGEASVIGSDLLAKRNREGAVRRSIQQITEGADSLLQTHSVGILADTPVQIRKDLVAVLVSAMVREIGLSQQLIETLRHDDLLDMEAMFVRVDNALGELSVALQNRIREMGR